MFTLKYEFDGYESPTLVQPSKTVQMTLDTNEANIDELCEFFGDFLKASGYCFNGNIQLVSPADQYADPAETEPDINEEITSRDCSCYY